MPIADPNAGRLFVWLVTSFILMSLATGGGFLMAYMYIQGPNWYMYVGMTLICLPWMFWIFTCVYRCFSRCFGFRIVIGGDGGAASGGAGSASSRRSGSLAPVNRLSSLSADKSNGKMETMGSNGSQRLASEEAIAVDGVQGNDHANSTGRNNGMSRASSNSSLGNTSYRSYESEVPLASAMAK